MNNHMLQKCCAWTALFLGNLIVPLMFGLCETQSAGLWGLLAALVLFWTAGLCCNWLSTQSGRALHYGAVFTALLQLFFYFHLTIGAMAVGIAEKYKSVPHDQYVKLDTFVSGFIATFLTGGCLMVLAFFVGSIVLALTSLFERPPATAPTTDLSPVPAPSPPSPGG